MLRIIIAKNNNPMKTPKYEKFQKSSPTIVIDWLVPPPNSDKDPYLSSTIKSCVSNGFAAHNDLGIKKNIGRISVEPNNKSSNEKFLTINEIRELIKNNISKDFKPV